MASIRDKILDALVTRFSLTGWVVEKRAPTNVLNYPKAAYVYDDGESGDTNRHTRYEMNLDVKVIVRVQIEDSANAYVEVDAALVELQQVLHSPPLEDSVTGLVRCFQTGHTKGDPDESNMISLEWRLTADYIHDYADPEVYTAAF